MRTTSPKRVELPHNTLGRFNKYCPWPERVGCLVTVMGTDGAEHQYPVHGMGHNEVVVHVSEDPLERPGGPAILPNGLPWSCVTSVDTIDVLGRAADNDAGWERLPDQQVRP